MVQLGLLWVEVSCEGQGWYSWGCCGCRCHVRVKGGTVGVVVGVGVM